ncbi:hypothetical protein GGR54DRAFT_155336 [Hypoxylon sp. NC1633]|nr:hypothetical protein GGR54DRAFT_155336 [Hypoxylon sp. NC1633]
MTDHLTMEEQLRRDMDALEQRCREAEHRADEAEQLTRATTLDEYLDACHNFMFTHFAVERDRPEKREWFPTSSDICRPAKLARWTDFPAQQRTALQTLYGIFDTEQSCFEDEHVLRVNADKRLVDRTIGSEDALEYFLHFSVEEPVQNIMSNMKREAKVCQKFAIEGGVFFHNHPNALDDSRVAHQAIERFPDRSQLDQGRGYTHHDQVCVCRHSNDGAVERALYICDYKAPHKLTIAHLRTCLRLADSLDIFQDVADRETTLASADPASKFEYHAERLTIAALSHTYNYMINNGLEYGLMTTGEAIMFLKVDWEQTRTLYYHLAEPGAEIEACLDKSDVRYHTPVSQYLAFTLITLGSPPIHPIHNSFKSALAQKLSKKWKMDFESTYRSIPSSEFEPPDPSYLLRDDTGQNHGQGQSQAQQPRRSNRIAQKSVEAQQPEQAKQPEKPQKAAKNEEAEPYCTHKCLMGLINNAVLDKRCPNVALHRQSSSNSCHALDHATFQQHLQDQLAKTLDKGLTPLHLQTDRSVLFRARLLSHGYTFIAKGTTLSYITALRHEAKIYERLSRVQGELVPVFLGHVDLRPLKRTYYYQPGVSLYYFVLLSWGGDPLDSGSRDLADVDVDLIIERLGLLHRQGVVHGAVRLQSVLADPRSGKLMLANFDRASIVKPPPRVPKKRGRGREEQEEGEGKAKEIRIADLSRDEFKILNELGDAKLIQLDMPILDF